MQELNEIKELNYSLPATIEECTERIKWLNEVNTRASIATWMVIYQAKELIGENKPWQIWVMTNYPKCKNESHIYQMYNVGELLAEKLDQKIFKILAVLNSDKLRALASMEKETSGSIEKFLEKYDAVTMTREELIEQINIERGRGNKGKSAKPVKARVNPNDVEQLEFSFFVNDIAEWEEEEITRQIGDSSINATKTASASMRLLNIAVGKMESGEEIIQSDKDAILFMLEGALSCFKGPLSGVKKGE